MKKLIYIIIILGIALTSCNKPADFPLEQDVIFKAAAAETGFKSADICNNDIAHYALITLQPFEADGITENGASFTKTVDIFYLTGTMYTNTLKLAPGKFEVTSFILMNDGPDNLSETNDDVAVYAAPGNGSTFGSLVNSPLPIPFTVGAFMKNEVNLEVLCFEPADYDKFGFTWFAIDYTTVTNNDMYFFGDFCTKYFADYETNEFYDDQMFNGSLHHDLIAIFKIQVLKQNGTAWDIIGTYTNELTSMSGAPLIVPHPDDPNVIGENFKFKLYILVKNGTGFSYKKFHVWTITDDGQIPSGDDNVIDFVLGSCTPSADLVLPPYMNLPATATLYTKTGVPGNFGTYFDITLSDIEPGFDIENGDYGVYCADNTTYITLNQTYYNMNVFSSLYVDLVPASFNLQKSVLDNINWLGNNLYRYPGYTFKDVQNAIWLMLGQITPYQNGGLLVPTQIAIKMKNDAQANGTDYLPPVGGFAAVLFISPDATSTLRDLQLLFTLVDP